MKQTTVAVIGGGPAGVSATVYLRRALIDVLLIERGVPGGKVNFTAEIENYPGFVKVNGPDLALKFYEQVNSLGVSFTYGDVSKVITNEDHFIIQTDEEEIKAEYVIFATGMEERKLGVPGEEEYNGRGVHFCAVCDGPFYKGESVMVVGGGNSAFQEAVYLAGFSKKVYLIHRSDKFKAEEILVKKAKATPNIEIILHTEVAEVIGDGDKVTSIIVENNQTNERSEFSVSALFPYIGQLPMSAALKDLNVTDERGYVIVNDVMETSIPNLFAAGDVIKKGLRQVVTATNDGAIAAIEITHRVA